MKRPISALFSMILISNPKPNRENERLENRLTTNAQTKNEGYAINVMTPAVTLFCFIISPQYKVCADSTFS